MHYPAAYPAMSDARDRFVVDLRAPRPHHNAWRYQDLIVEDERTADGAVVRVGTVFLTGRECPWRCVMCDLWRSTTPDDTPRGAIAAQVAAARDELRRRAHPVEPVEPVEPVHNITQMKLYNAGSFFDPRAVPEADYDAIAAHLAGLERVIVESHPALVGPRVDLFLDALGRNRPRSAVPVKLEVAMGLETAHADALERLHKRMTLGDFAAAADRLRRRDVGLRVFLLVAPPFVPADEQEAWLLRSIDVAFACGAGVVSLVPTRSGNGAMEALTAAGEFRQPHLADIERSVNAAFSRVTSQEPRARRVFVDVWDLHRFADCPQCVDARRGRLHAMNLEQRVLPPIACPHCATIHQRRATSPQP
jgi:radical SAM enzyme (TIGR01210 family)